MDFVFNSGDNYFSGASTSTFVEMFKLSFPQCWVLQVRYSCHGSPFREKGAGKRQKREAILKAMLNSTSPR